MEIRNRHWIKLWIKDCLTGTIREDLTPEERGVWYDVLLLAGWNRISGQISSNEKVAMPIERIAAWLNTPAELLERCLNKFVKSERIKVDKYGVIHIQNWEKYQYSDYDRQKTYRQKEREEERRTPRNEAE